VHTCQSDAGAMGIGEGERDRARKMKGRTTTRQRVSYEEEDTCDERTHDHTPTSRYRVTVLGCQQAHAMHARGHTQTETLLKCKIPKIGGGGGGGDVRKAGLIKTNPTLLALAPSALTVCVCMCVCVCVCLCV
jgi:hypothetical protein